MKCKKCGSTEIEKAATKGDVQAAAETWKETLRFFDMGRTLLPYEDVVLGRAIQQYSLTAVHLALIGARFEPKTEKFDPAGYVQLNRYLEAKNFQRFLNLGTKAARKHENLLKRAPEPDPGPEEYVQDTIRIKPIMKGMFK